jgi:enoyl-CoA hydratase/carnithine racemase
VTAGLSASDRPVRLERDGAVGLIVLDRAAKRNALDLAMRSALAAAVLELQNDAAVRVMVITGAGGVFAAGEPLPAPRLGVHTQAVLGELLGLGEAQVARLVETGIVGPGEQLRRRPG